jgi:hypothetical protein
MSSGKCDVLTPKTKRCWHCKETKPLAGFAKAVRERDGLQTKCRECAAVYMQEYRANNKERIKALNAASNARRGQPKPLKVTHTLKVTNALTLAQCMHNMVLAGK